LHVAFILLVITTGQVSVKFLHVVRTQGHVFGLTTCSCGPHCKK